MKTFLQGLLCLFLISALNQPCQAKLSARSKKTLIYYIAGASVIIVTALAGGGVIYYQRSRKSKQKALSDAVPTQQESDGLGLVTPIRNEDPTRTMNEVQAPTTPHQSRGRPSLRPRTPHKCLLRLHPKTPENHPFIGKIVAGSALTHLSPEKLQAVAPKLTFGVPYPIEATPPHEQHKRSCRISIGLARMAQNSSYVDGGVLVSGMERFRGSDMPSPDIGINRKKDRFHRTRVPGSTEKH